MLSQTGRNAKQTVCCTEEISITFLQEVTYLKYQGSMRREALKAPKQNNFFPYTTCSDPTALLVKQASRKVLLYCACNYSSRTIFEEISAIPSLHKSGTFF